MSTHKSLFWNNLPITHTRSRICTLPASQLFCFEDFAKVGGEGGAPVIDAIRRSASTAFTRVGTVAILLTLLTLPALGQVITPTELSDPKLQRLQQRHFRTLVDIGGEVQRYKFPYPFYLSRVLDVDIAKMKDVDQRSIRFDSY